MADNSDIHDIEQFFKYKLGDHYEPSVLEAVITLHRKIQDEKTRALLDLERGDNTVAAYVERINAFIREQVAPEMVEILGDHYEMVVGWAPDEEFHLIDPESANSPVGIQAVLAFVDESDYFKNTEAIVKQLQDFWSPA